MSELQTGYVYAVETKPQPDPNVILELLNYLTSAQVACLTGALAAIRDNGGYGQLRLVVENGMATFIASEVSIKLPRE
jgi:hypothetical protein